MMKRLHLPLTALRTFESAARHESFADAAHELAITQPAVSKQIVLLETRLGVTLFSRAHRSVHLTEKGRRLAARLTDAFDRMTSAIEETGEEVRHTYGLTVTVDTDFAALWLLPKLPNFERRNPHIEVSIATEVDPAAFDPDVSDCAVLWGEGGWNDCQSEPLFTNSVFPVCTPAIAAQLRAQPERLHGMRLIHDRTTKWWRLAATEMGMPDLNWLAGPVYSQTALCLEATLRGDGITIGDEVSTWHHLENGTLAIPFGVLIPSSGSYYFLQKTQGKAAPNVSTFHCWLTREVETHRRLMADYWQRQQ